MTLNRDDAVLWLPIVGGFLGFLGGHFQMLQMAFPGLGPEWNARLELLSAFIAFLGAYGRKSPLPLSQDSDLRGLKNPDQTLTLTGKLPFILLFLLVPSTLSAQALPSSTERRWADVASYATVGLTIALDTKASCLDAVDRKRGCLLQAARVGSTWAAVALLKHVFPRDRPCAPDCGIDPVNEDVPSGHTAFALQAMEGPRMAVTIPLAVTSGGLRLGAGKHDWLGVLTGAAVGGAIGHWVR